MENNNYVAFHVHSDYSLLDSCTKFQDYVDKAVELKQPAICISEHGNLYNWIEKKMYCDKAGIKYLHGVEVYLTETIDEKIRDNYHTILIAKNYAGVLEINQLISLSYEGNHFYYKNRITFNEFLKISGNVIKISSCLASPLNKLDINNIYYEKLSKHYDYYEIQPHPIQEQIDYNRHLAQWAEKYNKPLIAGTDTHSINKYKAECRNILLTAKHIVYTDEETIDLTYKTYDELIESFKKQDAIPERIYMNAIKNTNIMAESVDEFTLDTSFKYPKLYGDKDNEKYEQACSVKLQEKIDKKIIPPEQIEKFKEAIKEESRVFDIIDMKGFMLSMSEFCTWCKENDIPIGFNRGSCGGSRVAYVLDITDLNPETWNTVFSRFANESRKEIGDIDIDVSPSDRSKVYDYIIERFGKQYATFILAIGTISSKGTIDEIGRALSLEWEIKNNPKTPKKSKVEVENNPECDEEKLSANNPYSLETLKRIKSEFESDEPGTRKKYKDIFYYYDGLIDTRISQSIHPAGIVVSPITLPDHYGTFIREDKVVLQVDMECVHEVSLVKYDILGLKNIEIIKDTCKLIGMPYPKSHEIDWSNQGVWADMLKSPVGIFQFEGEFAFTLLKQYEPHSIFDMSLITAALRPSGASYRNDLIKHISHKNPSLIIDELLKENNGYLIYQEDTIKFLQQICGLSGSDADNVRRAIGRKDEERLKKALPQILKGYCKKSSQPEEIAIQEAQSFLKIIEDSANYQFGMNHSIGYCMIGFICAYLRYYYPYEFITAYLNNADKEDDIKNGSELANDYNIRIVCPEFGLSKDKYVFDKDKKVISKGISSIKYLNSAVANELYELSKHFTSTFFVDLLYEITSNTCMNSRQLDILIRLDYFKRFGNVKELLKIVEIYDFFKQGNAKTIKIEKISDPEFQNIIKQYSTNKNIKGNELKTYTITDMNGMLIHCEKYIKSLSMSDFTYKMKISDQLEFLGYVDLITNLEEDRQKLFVTDVKALKGERGVWGYAVFTKSIGSGKAGRLTVRTDAFKKQPIKKEDIIYAESISKSKRGFWDLNRYYQIM